MSKDLVTIATFTDPSQAHLMKGKLEQSGILCCIQDESVSNILPHYSMATGGMRLQVPSDDVERAEEVKKEIIDPQGRWSGTQEDCAPSAAGAQDVFVQPDPVVCPQCGSDDISSKRINIIMAVLSIITILPILFRRPQWICGKCGHKWK